MTEPTLDTETFGEFAAETEPSAKRVPEPSRPIEPLDQDAITAALQRMGLISSFRVRVSWRAHSPTM